MKLLILMLCILFTNLVAAKSEHCLESTEECHSTDYESYVKCVRGRQKRSTGCQQSSCSSGNCDNSCDSCDCDSCTYTSCDSCNACCSSCCSNFVSCRTHHCCHKTCHAQCQTSDCRSSCRKNCFSSVSEKEREIQIGESSSPQQTNQNSNTNITNANAHNITTIIHLNNVINNTNIVDVPIVLNNTNTQNITLYNEVPQARQEERTTEEKCCTVIGPRQCVSGNKPRCFHYRSKQCGAFCTAEIVHKEQQQVCTSLYPGAQPSCRQQILYIPQPQPRCVYQSVWPYVSCGVRRSETCHGCYSHYVDQLSQNYLTCPSQCYDQGYSSGPLYRQGPLYQPFYSHVPCYGCMGLPNPNPNPYGMMGIYPGNIGGYDPTYGNFPGYQPQPSYFDNVNFTSGNPSGLLGEDSFRMRRELEIKVKYEMPSDEEEVEIQEEDEEIAGTLKADSVPNDEDSNISIKQA